MNTEERSPAGFIVLLAMAVAFVLYVTSLTDMIGRGFDDGQYAVLARALAEGVGFSQLSLVGQPPEGRYPFGFPLLLAPIWWLPLDMAWRVYALKMTSALASVTSAALGYFYLTRRGYSGSFTAAFVVILGLFNPLVFLYSREVFSEMSYLAISLLALYFIEAYAKEDGAFQPLSHVLLDYRLLLSLLTTITAFYTRSVGISLVIAAVLYLAGRGAWRRSAVFAAGSGLLIIPWVIRGQIALGSSNMGYLAQFLQRSLDDDLGTVSTADLLERVVVNLRDYIFGGIPGAVFPSVSPFTWINLPEDLKIHPAFFVPTLLVAFLILVNLLVGVLFKRRLLDLYVVVYLLICLFWPWEPTRFLVPLILFLNLYFTQSFVDISRLFRWNVVSPVRGIACFLVGGYLLMALVGEVRLIQAVKGETQGLSVEQAEQWQEVQASYLWIREKTPGNSVISAVNDAQAYYYTQRKVAQVLDSAQGMLETKVDYIVLIPFPTLRTGKDLTLEKFDPVMQQYPDAFKEEYRSYSGIIKIYRVQRDILAGKLNQ